MRVLLDTHAFLWAASDSPRLGERARSLFLDPHTSLLLSVASVWEMAIKASLGKLRLRLPLEQLVAAGLEQRGLALLPIELDHVLRVQALPWHHRDGAFDGYEVERIW